MKLLYSVLAFFALVSADLDTRDVGENGVQKTVNINKLVDRFNPQLALFIVSNDLDPLELPSTNLSFITKRPGDPIKYKTYLSLSSGKLDRLAHLQRDGETTLTYANRIVTLNLNVKVKLLMGSYDYAVKLLLLKRRGNIRVSTTNVHANAIVTFNTMNYTLSLQKVELQTPRHIKVVVRSRGGLPDWIATTISNIVAPLLKKTITKTMKTEIAIAVQKVFNNINRKISRNMTTY